MKTYWIDTTDTYKINADTEDEAIEKIQSGDYDDPQLEFIDWYDDNYEIEHTECIDPLYKMVKDYDTNGI